MPEYIQWLRARLGPALVPLVYATAIVRNAAGEILFQRRSDFGAAWWGLPGGLFEPGEPPASCVQREVLEETGLRVNPHRLAGVYSSLRYAVTYPNGHQVQQVTLCYECALTGGQLRPQAGEIDSQAFFPPDALPTVPLWYADMLAHTLQRRAEPYFDTPEHTEATTPFANLQAVRQFAGAGPLVWPAASAVVFDSAGRLLLSRSDPSGAWDLPGGLLETGETLAHTVVRACRATAGLLVSPYRLLDFDSGIPLATPTGVYPVTGLFACYAQPAPGVSSPSELRYFAHHDLPPTSAPAQGRLAAAFSHRAS